MEKIEVKQVELLEFKALSGEGEFEGYAAIFNNVDMGNDKILPGAFEKTLKKTKGKIPILDGHCTRCQIGWNLEASEDAKGLKVHGQLNLDVGAGSDKYALAKQAKEVGAKMGLSIGYASKKSDWEGDVRLLREVKLFEYSLVAFPMNDKATVTNIKGGHLVLATGDPLENVRDFEDLLREAGFSRTKAKAISSYAFNSQCDADVKDVLEAIEKASNALRT
jgi:hypothetical protein